MSAKSGFLHGCWEEVVGELFSLEKNDQWLTVKLTITLVFPVKGLEAKIIEEKLREVEAGKLVRTDLSPVFLDTSFTSRILTSTPCGEGVKPGLLGEIRNYVKNRDFGGCYENHTH